MSTSSMWRGRRRLRATLVASAAAFGLFLAFGAGNAFAFSCSGGNVLTITMANETVTVSKGTASIIMANGAVCGISVSDTDLIIVNGNGVADNLVIDLGGGYFEPGDDTEVAGINEVEWRLGTEGSGGGVETLTILGNNSPDLITIGAGVFYDDATNALTEEQDDNGNDTIGTDTDGVGADTAGVTGFINMNDDEDADIFLDEGVSRPAISVYGLNGNDKLSGKGTKGTGGTALDDLYLNGGAGDDLLQGGDGDDWLVPGAGNDTVDGDADSSATTQEGTVHCDELDTTGAYAPDTWGDTVDFSDSPAAITADLDPGEAHPGTATGDGTDVLQNVESLNGSDFNDTLSGNNNNNILAGGAGDDVLAGDAGNDCVLGEDGNDTLNENEGTSLAEGSPDGWQNGADDLSGGAGADDVIDYSGRSTRVVINLGIISWNNDGADPDADSITEECDDVYFDTENAKSGSGNDMISADFSNNQSDNEFWGGTGNDQMDGGAGNDTFHEDAAANGSDMMSGRGGSDTVDYSLRTNAVMVTLDGVSNDGEAGEGDNTAAGMVSYGTEGVCPGVDGETNTGFATAANAPEPFYNVEATDVSSVENVEGGSGNDEIVGDQSGNILNGNAGNDTVRGGAGTDSLNGGDGDDTLEGGAGNDAMNGGEGTDWADYASAGSGGVGVQVNLTTGSATGDGNDTLSGIENASGSSFADSLRGDAGNNVLNGRGGNDAIQGLAGDDTINGGPGVDELGGGAGDDSLAGGSGADALRGGGGNDTLQGGPGADTLMGMKGDDSLSGNAGKDFHKGGPGSDRCIPGTPGLSRGDIAIGCEA